MLSVTEFLWSELFSFKEWTQRIWWIQTQTFPWLNAYNNRSISIKCLYSSFLEVLPSLFWDQAFITSPIPLYRHFPDAALHILVHSCTPQSFVGRSLSWTPAGKDRRFRSPHLSTAPWGAGSQESHLSQPSILKLPSAPLRTREVGGNGKVQSTWLPNTTVGPEVIQAPFTGRSW